MSFELIEDAVNEVSDRDASWWPFLWLRPRKDENLSLGRLVLLAALYGAPFSAALGALLACLAPHARTAIAGMMATLPLVFLAVTTGLVGPMWNRRAERIRRRERGGLERR